jgi:hypothetical protein
MGRMESVVWGQDAESMPSAPVRRHLAFGGDVMLGG